METSIFIAQFMGVVYLTIGLGMLFSKKHYQRMYDDFLKSEGQIYLGGLMALSAGFLIVTFHNNWEGGWPLIITILGWASLLKGIHILAFPEHWQKFVKGFMKDKSLMNVSGFLAVVLGAILVYFGYLA